MTYNNTEEGRWLEGVGEDAVAPQRGGSEPGHLPECYASWPARSPLDQCICARLRACEARVIATCYSTKESSYEVGREHGYAAALDAARDAVAAVRPAEQWGSPTTTTVGGFHIRQAAALAAIDEVWTTCGSEHTGVVDG